MCGRPNFRHEEELLYSALGLKKREACSVNDKVRELMKRLSEEEGYKLSMVIEDIFNLYEREPGKLAFAIYLVGYIMGRGECIKDVIANTVRALEQMLSSFSPPADDDNPLVM